MTATNEITPEIFHEETVRAIDRSYKGIRNIEAYELESDNFISDKCFNIITHYMCDELGHFKSVHYFTPEEFQLFLCFMLTMNETGDIDLNEDLS